MDKPDYKPIFYFLGRHRLLFAGILLVTLIASVLESFSVAAFFPLFTATLGDSSQEVGGILGLFDHLAGLLPFGNAMVAASVLLLVMFVAKTLFNFGLNLVVGFAGATVHYGVKKEMMDRYSAAHYQYFLDNQQGVLMFNVLHAPGSVSTALVSGAQLVASLFKSFALIAVLVSIFPIAAFAVVILGLVYYIFIHYLSKKVSFSLAQKQTIASSELTVIANDFFSGFRQIITFNVASQWTDRFDKSNRTIKDVTVRTVAWNAIPRPITELSAVGLMVGVILTLSFTSADGFSDALPRLGVFAVALVQLLPTLSNVGLIRMGLMSALPNMDRSYQTIKGPVPMRHQGSIALESFDKAIAFEGLTFAYKNMEPVLKGVDLTFEKGKVTAIVGSSGSGKTTIVNLILGLFEPTEGRVTVDGIPLSDIKSETWLNRIGSVSQDTFTYHTSIAENIQFGRNGCAQETMVAAAKVANAHGFISQHPQGYGAIVGDRGMRLSGGQQQRLAIARAMLDSPEILIFDEATSSLDTISEKQVKEAITRVSTDRTVIIVAHRLSTISHADKIIVLHDGQVAEEGTHEELLELEGQYARLAAT